jgi:trehalose synthase
MMYPVTVVDVPARVSSASAASPDAEHACRSLEGKTVWHVNSTATGGGVAELLYATVSAHRSAGIESQWLVPSGDHAFFEITKQLHHLFHGSAGRASALTDEDRALYAKTTSLQAESVLQHVRPGDVVVLHDPQPLGMARMLDEAGAVVVWRSHIGTSTRSPHVSEAWSFLSEFLGVPRRVAFSSHSFVPSSLEVDRVDLIRPSINPDSIKCSAMSASEVREILSTIGLTSSATSTHVLMSHARVIQDVPLPVDSAVVLQLSRWDPLKDMAGVLDAFARYVAPYGDAHLVLAGPDPDDIPDDPENAAIMREVLGVRDRLPVGVRKRVHLVVLSLRDLNANARIVNALQRHATVITQKSLQEGFGIAITEAMFKRRPVVASAVGGILEQVIDNENGLLIADPSDLESFGAAVRRLLEEQGLRESLAHAAYETCTTHFLVRHELAAYCRMYAKALES